MSAGGEAYGGYGNVEDLSKFDGPDDGWCEACRRYVEDCTCEEPAAA